MLQKQKNRSDPEHFPAFKALRGDDPEGNAGTIHASNPEHLPVFKAPHGDDPEGNAGTIHPSNPEHLPVFKAPRGDDLEGNAGKIHPSNPEHHLVFKTLRRDNPEQKTGTIQIPIRNNSPFLRLYAGTIRNRTQGQSTQKDFTGKRQHTTKNLHTTYKQILRLLD